MLAEFRTPIYALVTLVASAVVTITLLDSWRLGERQPEQRAVVPSTLREPAPAKVQDGKTVTQTAGGVRPEAASQAVGTGSSAVPEPAMSQPKTDTSSGPSPSYVAPRLVKRVEPQYTQEALSNKIEGTVELAFYVLPAGNVRTIRVIRRLDTGLDQSAIEAVAHWHYEPALVNGRPATVQITERITFHLP